MARLRKVACHRQLKRCPDCGYTDGFHVMFSRESEKSRKFRLYLICPMCSGVYDIGLRCDTVEGG